MAMAAPQGLTELELQESWYRFSGNAAARTVDLYVVGDIGAWGVSARQFARDLAEQAKGAAVIKLYLHSLGGDIMEGLAIYNMLLNHPARVEVYIAGIAASMGSVIAMAGDVIHIPENGWIMVHKPWGGQIGDAEQMRRYAELLDQWEDSLVLAYEKKTGKSREELADLLASETWLMGQDAIDLGFADQLTDAVEMVAKANNRAKDFLNMPKRLATLMNPRGEGGQPPAAPVQTPAPQAAAPAPAPAPTPAADPQAQFREQEQNRRNGINAVFDGFGSFGELQRQCLDNMDCTESMAKDKLLAALGGNGSAPAGAGRIAHIHAGNGEFVRQGMANALAARAGVEAYESDNSYRGMALVEMARMALTESGVSAYGLDRMEMIGLAFTHSSSDFGNILQDVAHKALLQGVEAAQETFQLWTKKGQLSDFKLSNRVALDGFPALDEVPDGGKYQQANINDRGESIKLATYGKLFGISRQTIMNDDLQAFTEIPNLMGRAALRTVGNLVYALLMANPKMRDGKELFHASHGGNLGDAAALSMAALDAASTVMAMQEDSAGTVLNVEPKFLIVGRKDKGKATSLMESEFDPDVADSNNPNIVRNMATVIADARIDQAAKKANVKVPWFLAADPAFGTIEVAYLDGNEQPHLEQKEGWTTDGAQFKVRHDAGVAALSATTMYKNPGQ